VAERAGVSVRTVWQHFDDLEALFVAAAARDLALVGAHVEPVDPRAPLAERVRVVAVQRGHMFEQLGPVWRAGRLQEPFSAQIRAHRDRLVQMGREQVAHAFACELDRTPAATRALLLDALHIVTTWATWESMRTDLGLDVETATQTVIHMLTGLLPATRSHRPRRFS
jgi:TetR/AcrR family transcriptional regulator of autoinduction and epiphytic fitness